MNDTTWHPALLSLFLCSLSTATSAAQESASETAPRREPTFRIVQPPRVVLPPGVPNAWDAHTIYGPTVVERDQVYHMLYVGNRVRSAEDYTKGMGLGYATSADGVQWEKQGDGPNLIHARAGRAATGAYFLDQGKWAVLYTIPSKNFFAQSGVYLATADEPGGPWSAREEAVIQPPEDSWCETITPLNVYRSGDEIRLYFYGSNRALGLTGFGLATSTNLVNWTLHDDPTTTDDHHAQTDPFLTPGPEGAWDGIAVTSGSILPTDAGWEMFYVGYDRPVAQRDPGDEPLWLGHAVSTDGIHWSKNTRNPVLQTNQTIWPLTCVLRKGREYWFYQDTSGGQAGISFFTAQRI